ncbi:MAG: sulfotransferase family 2 domain-containing protein [Agriterribacter sp.]
MNIPDTTVIESFFGQNYICRIPNTNLSFLFIAKNASSFLHKVVLYNKMGNWPKPELRVHREVRQHPDKSLLLFDYTELKKIRMVNPGLIVFSVWRDPLERFLSTYKLFILERRYFEYYAYMGFYSRKVSIDDFINYAEFELSKPPQFQDEHIRQQVDYYESTSDVDLIVHINDLFKFLDKHNVKYIHEKSNQTKNNINYITDSHIGRIKKLYSEDYKIQPNFK